MIPNQTYIEFFISRVEIEFNKRFFRMGRSHSGMVRPASMFIVWKFNGFSVTEVAKLFHCSKPNAYACIRRMEGYYDTDDILFKDFYDKILSIYNKSVMSYVKNEQNGFVSRTLFMRKLAS